MTGEGLECQVMITKDWFIFQCRGVRNTENLRAAGCCGTDAPGPLEVSLVNREPGEEVGTQWKLNWNSESNLTRRLKPFFGRFSLQTGHPPLFGVFSFPSTHRELFQILQKSCGNLRMFRFQHPKRTKMTKLCKRFAANRRASAALLLFAAHL